MDLLCAHTRKTQQNKERKIWLSIWNRLSSATCASDRKCPWRKRKRRGYFVSVSPWAGVLRSGGQVQVELWSSSDQARKPSETLGETRNNSPGGLGGKVEVVVGGSEWLHRQNSRSRGEEEGVKARGGKAGCCRRWGRLYVSADVHVCVHVSVGGGEGPGWGSSWPFRVGFQVLLGEAVKNLGDAAAPCKGGCNETLLKQSRTLVRGQLDPRQTQPETSCSTWQLLETQTREQMGVRLDQLRIEVLR